MIENSNSVAFVQAKQKYAELLDLWSNGNDLLKKAIAEIVLEAARNEAVTA